MRSWLFNKFCRWFKNDIQFLLVAERVRVWQELYSEGSTQIIPGAGPDGGNSYIKSISTLALEEIIFPKLPSDYALPGYFKDGDVVPLRELGVMKQSLLLAEGE